MDRWIVFFILLIYALPNLALPTIKVSLPQEQLALPYWPPKNKIPNQGAVVVIKGGQPAYGSLALKKLCKLLSQAGWMVILLNDKPFLDKTAWVDQLPGILSALRQKGEKRLIVIHYGDEFQQTRAYFLKPQSKQVNGLVLLSAFDRELKKDAELTTNNQLRFPAYEIVGEFDYENVIRQAEDHIVDFNPQDYQFFNVPGALHDYQYNIELLASYLHGWMSQQPMTEIGSLPSIENNAKPPTS